MTFVEPSAHAQGVPPALAPEKIAGHRIDGDIVDARRCTVQMQNGFLYLDALASQATALLGHDLPEPEDVDRARLTRALAGLHPNYEFIAACADTGAALLLARKLGTLIAGDARSVRLVGADGGEPSDASGIVVAIENETIGRRGAWFASSEWRTPPSFIVAGNVLAAGEQFGALFVERGVAGRIPASAINDFAPATERAAALVQAIVVEVESQRLIAKAKELTGYFHDRLQSVQTTCKEIVEIQFAGLAAKIRFEPEVSPVQLKRKLCERGLLVGVDERGWIVVRPPLAIRPAEVDVITGVLRGALLGTATARAPVCCSACQGDGD